MSRTPWFVTVALSATLSAAVGLGCKKEQPKSTEAEPAASRQAPEPADQQPPQPKPAEAAETPASSMPQVGDAAPAFKTVAHDGTEVSVEALRGEPFVLYFYPRDETPG